MHSSKFKSRVLEIVSLIPNGRVVSYGQVALYAGAPRAARQVGWILNKLPEDTALPWWRVVNNQGRVSIKGSKYSAELQKQLLMQEGVEVSEDLTFEIEQYRFIPNEKFVKKLKLDEDYLISISEKIDFS